MYDLLLRDATLVTGASRRVCDVAIRDGKIAFVGARPRREAAQTINAAGKFLMPGIIDVAVQFDPNDDGALWEPESRAAVTGGVTTVVALPTSSAPVVDGRSAAARAERAAGRSFTHFAFWGDALAADPAALAEATRAGQVIGSLLTVDDDSEGAAPDRLSAMLGLPGVVGVRLARSGRDAGAVQSVIERARRGGRSVPLLHLSTADEVTALDPVYGVSQIAAGVTPHHLFLAVEDFGAPEGLPIRRDQDRRSLWTAMKKGWFDFVASDHHPARPGLPGAEIMLPLLLSAVRYGRIPLERVVALCSEAPARLFGLDGKGSLEVGADADLVLFSEGDARKVAADQLLSVAGWTPYADREAAAKPDLVLVGGVVTAVNGRVVVDQPAGRWIGN